MTRWFDDPDYNPRRGAGRSGRVRKEDFSIDGKSWDYRDPYNQRLIDRQNMGERERVYVNEHSQSMTNPLYDYDYGRVRDAAKVLGINNVNSKKEVDEILNYIQDGGKAMKEEKPQEEVVEETSEPAVFTPSDAHQEARSDFEAKQNNPIPRMSDQPGLADGTSDPMMDAIRHGDDLNDWFQRETEKQKADAKLGAYEMGERTRFFANQFVGKVPELGDVGKLYESYADKLKDKD